MAGHESTNIESILQERRKFEPPAKFSQAAKSKASPSMRRCTGVRRRILKGSGPNARANLTWFKPFGQVLEWKLPFAKWFIGGELNASYNCLDRHLTGARRNKVALIWEGEPGDTRVLTYQMLADEVARCANALKSLGVQGWRPRRDLHAAGARSRDRDAGVRADRRDSFGNLRRLLGGGAGRSNQ